MTARETQRVIKYRAWDINLRVMQENIHVLDRFAEILSRDQYTIMQFTGLLDKHGKEIYEGDRLCGEFNKKGQRITKERYGTVVFAFGGFHVIYDDEPKSHYNMTYKYRFEVIGNIYTTPELVDPKMIER